MDGALAGMNVRPLRNLWTIEQTGPPLIHFPWAPIKNSSSLLHIGTRDCSPVKTARRIWAGHGQQTWTSEIGQDLQNWIEVYEMFAKLYHFIPW